jgi:hypothetical protein
MSSRPFIEEGVIVDTNDPQQMSRVKVWVPAIDGDSYKVSELPWAKYMSPLGGQTRDYPAGPNSSKAEGFASYGLVLPPKSGACVVVGFFYGDPNRRVVLGSFWRDHGNRSLPRGRNGDGPQTDVLSAMEPAASNLRAQFGGNLTASEARTRGAYERQVAQAKTEKDGTEGYQTNVIDPKLDNGKANYDPQTYALTTPGRHSIIMQDNPTNGRVRIVTAAGHQVILDDANERIYVSTARGASWFEMDQDGRVHLYGADDIAITSGGKLDITVVKDLSVNAGGNINLQAGGTIKLGACGAFHASGAGVNLESNAAFNILAAGNLIQTGSNIHLNGPDAAAAECPDLPTIVPTQEPWTRATSKQARNAQWKA